MLINWAKKYAGRRAKWEIRRGEEALALIEEGGKSREELMETMGLGEESLERILKTVRPKIWLVQFGKKRIYERRTQ
jgi:hypothetical protein